MPERRGNLTVLTAPLRPGSEGGEGDMRVKFLKSVASIFGGFVPGMVADIPNESIARSWCNAGIAEEAEGKVKAIKAKQIITQEGHKIIRERPDVIPAGLFWCGKCNTFHKETSTIGKKHHKHLTEFSISEE